MTTMDPEGERPDLCVCQRVYDHDFSSDGLYPQHPPVLPHAPMPDDVTPDDSYDSHLQRRSLDGRAAQHRNRDLEAQSLENGAGNQKN